LYTYYLRSVINCESSSIRTETQLSDIINLRPTTSDVPNWRPRYLELLQMGETLYNYTVSPDGSRQQVLRT